MILCTVCLRGTHTGRIGLNLYYPKNLIFNLKNTFLILTLNFEVFSGMVYQKTQVHYAILSLKNPWNIWKSILNLKFESEDPPTLMSRLTALLHIDFA